MQTTTFLLTLVGAASALVARTPVAGTFDGANTLIQYQRWCPVCDTVATNNNCIKLHASCQASTLVVPSGAEECSERCLPTCQLSYVANSDYGYSCNATTSTNGSA